MSLHWQLLRVICQMMEWERKLERWGEQEGCKSAGEGSKQVDETFRGRLPPGWTGPHQPLRRFSVFLTEESLHGLVLIWWLHRNCQIWSIYVHSGPASVMHTNLLKVTNPLFHIVESEFKIWETPALIWVAARLASADTCSFRHKTQTRPHMRTSMHKCSHVHMTKVRIISGCLLFVHLSRTQTFIGVDQRRVSHPPPLQYATE